LRLVAIPGDRNDADLEQLGLEPCQRYAVWTGSHVKDVRKHSVKIASGGENEPATRPESNDPLDAVRTEQACALVLAFTYFKVQEHFVRFGEHVGGSVRDVPGKVIAFGNVQLVPLDGDCIAIIVIGLRFAGLLCMRRVTIRTA